MFDVSFFVRLERLLHLNLFVTSFLVQHLSFKTGDFLSNGRGFVHLTGGTFTLTFLMIESSTVSSYVLFDVVVLSTWEVAVVILSGWQREALATNIQAKQ